MPPKTNRAIIFLFVGLALLTVVSIARFNSNSDRIPWQEDYAAALRESALTQKPVFLDFTASWCGPCQSLKSSTWADNKVSSALSSYIPVRIDLDANPALAQQYHIDAIPAFIVLNAKQNATKSSVGYLDPDQFLDWLNPK